MESQLLQSNSFNKQIMQNIDLDNMHLEYQLDFDKSSILTKNVTEIEHINFHKLVNDLIFKFKEIVNNRPVKFINNIDQEIEFKSNAKNINVILANLFANSLCHGFGGDDEGIIKIAAFIEGNILSVNYFDTGKGLKEKELASILRGLELYQGEVDTGLKIVNQIILNMKGKLNIKNNFAETGLRIEFDILVG